jgi:hypothetical protein
VFESDGKPMVQLVVVANIVYPYLFSFSAFIFLNYFDCPAQTSRSQLKLIVINHYLLTSSVPPSAW